MNIKVSCVLALALISTAALADSTISINGKTYQCDGNMSYVNGTATCNGKSMDSAGGNSGKPCGEASVHRHRNADGSEGGWVNSGASVESSVYIGKDVLVCGTPTLKGRLRLLDKTNYSGTGTVIGRSPGGITISGSPIISGSLDLDGNVEITGSHIISGRLVMRQTAKLIGSTIISGTLTLTRDAVMRGSMIVSGSMSLGGATSANTYRSSALDQAVASIETEPTAKHVSRLSGESATRESNSGKMVIN